MATIIPLRAGQQPPEGEDWIQVERGAAGGFYVSWTIRTGDKAAVFAVSEALASQEAALEYARQEAEKRGVQTIYTKDV